MNDQAPWWFVTFITLLVVFITWMFYNVGHADGECQGYCIRAGEYVVECSVQKVTCATRPSWAVSPPVESK